MTWDEVRRAALHPLVTIGAHSLHHYNLRRLSEDDARREIADVAAVLAIELGETPKHMAYPYGYVWAVGEREVRLAEEAGFVSAVTTRHGLLLQLPMPAISTRCRGSRSTGVTSELRTSGRC